MRLNRVIWIAVALTVAAFCLTQFTSLRGQLGALPALDRPWLVPIAVGVLALTVVAYSMAWREIVCRLDHRATSAVDAFSVFTASWLGRYVPTSIPYLAGKVAMGGRIGHSREALVASLLYENALLIAVGAVSSAVIIPIALTGSTNLLVFALVCATGCLSIAYLGSPLLLRTLNLAARLLRRSPLTDDRILTPRAVVRVVLMVAIALTLNGAAFSLILLSFVDLSYAEVIAAAAIFNLAGVAGSAAVPVPSGIGVREGVLIGLLVLIVPIEVAAAAALVARFSALILDLALGGTGWLILIFRAGAPSRTPPTAVPAAESS